MADAGRRKRIQRLKKGIILALLLFVPVPIVLCCVLFVKLQSANRHMEALSGQIELLAQQTSTQQDTLQELLENIQTTVQGGQEENQAGRGLPEYDELAMMNTSVAEEETGSQDSVPAAMHKVYLTFDDGPSVNTEKILDILDQYGVKATFFVVGKEDETSKEALQEIVDRGHSLGMHSFTHKYTEVYNSVEAFAEDFVKLRTYLDEVTGVTSNIYRFPGGSSNTISNIDMREFAEYLESWGVTFYDWNISSGDGESRLLTVDELVENSLQGIESRETSIILFHDAVGKPTTVEALPEIIENILAMEDTVILPITADTEPVQHIHQNNNN